MTAFIQINNLALASALMTIGIPFDPQTPLVKTRRQGPDGKSYEQYTFQFQTQSICGQYQTSTLIEAWHNPTFNEEFPEHPFAYLKCGFENREFLLDRVKQSVALVIIEKNGKHLAISENASKELMEGTFRRF